MTGAGLPLERGAGTALWRQLELRLAREIAGSAPDSRLPSESALAVRFGVNRHTVRQAMRALAGRGLVRIEQGKGAFVQDLIDYRIGAGTRFTTNVLAAERLAHHELIELREDRADGDHAAVLRLRVGDPLLVVRSIGLADGVPLVVGGKWVALSRLPDARRRMSANPSCTSLYAAHGHHDYRRGETRVTARMPQADEARLLRMPSTTPVLVTEACDLGVDGTPLTIGRSVWASERVQFVIGDG